LDKGGGGDGMQSAASGSPGPSAPQGGVSEASASGRMSGAPVPPRVPRARQARDVSDASGACFASDPQPQPTLGAADDSLTGLESVLAAAIRAGRIDEDAEERAVAAFRAARDGAKRRSPRTRCRDDWQPRWRRGPGRSLRAVFGVLLASLTLGGVAMASMGVLSTPSGGGHGERPRPQQTFPEPTADEQSAAAPPISGAATPPESASAGSRGRDKAAGAKSSKALCRAYVSTKGRGRVLDATAWRRLVDAAGGEAAVKPYCDDQLASGKGVEKEKEKPGRSAADAGTAHSGKTAHETPAAAKQRAGGKAAAKQRGVGGKAAAKKRGVGGKAAAERSAVGGGKSRG
jgi:hypothetical protein